MANEPQYKTFVPGNTHPVGDGMFYREAVETTAPQAAFQPACFSNHMGAYCIEPVWFQAQFNILKAAGFKAAAEPQAAHDGNRYATVGNIAIIPIDGPMAKFDSKFGGTNTARVRQAIHSATMDESVRGIMLKIDSPGGNVAGTMELADDIAAAGQQKTVHAFYEDLAASAAVWVGSQASHISANATAKVGSIGIFAVLTDTSAKMEADGIVPIVVSSGGNKGAGADGKVTPELIAQAQAITDGLNEFFIAAVATGRNLPAAQVEAMADGNIHMAAQAQSLGLIDAVQPFGQAIRHLQATAAEESRTNTARARMLIAGGK